jgi:hypothetical protein
MKHLIKRIIPFAACAALWVLLGCEQLDTDFESFLDKGEITYPGVGTNFSYKPGKLRTALVWNPSPDPGIVKYVVYYNNRADSVTMEATSHNPADEVEIVVPDLLEYVYSFTVYAVDSKGNRSIPQEINNVKVYGEFYEGSLFNRPYEVTAPFELYEDGAIELNFTEAPDTINTVTLIKYTNTADQEVEATVAGDAPFVRLTDYKMGTKVLYRSAYVPEHTAIDQFWVTHYDTFPEIDPYTYVLTNKADWRESPLANDVGTYEGQTSVSKLWDGSEGPQGYPNIFHSNDKTNLPHHFTFDLGHVYRLSHIEETGRNCCHNPDQFEVWGIEDLKGAATALPSNDPGWKDEALARGWKLLKEVHRSDDGSAPYKVALDPRPPAVRYIRIRILHTANGNSNSSNLSEITFWHRQY